MPFTFAKIKKFPTNRFCPDGLQSIVLRLPVCWVNLFFKVVLLNLTPGLAWPGLLYFVLNISECCFFVNLIIFNFNLLNRLVSPFQNLRWESGMWTHYVHHDFPVSNLTVYFDGFGVPIIKKTENFKKCIFYNVLYWKFDVDSEFQVEKVKFIWIYYF